ncbi:Piwi-domain-containing protein [Marasmius fiardii PR-910]|nr:Piwi-domain-containing protein [Marasmius fiardii PR-910]
MVKFSQKCPNERFDAIKPGLSFLGHEQNEYVNNFGMTVDPSTLPMEIDGRVISPSTLKYGDEGKVNKVNPKFGSWNLIDMKLVDAKLIKHWGLVVFAGRGQFNNYNAQQMVKDLISGFGSLGMNVEQPILVHFSKYPDVSMTLNEAVHIFKDKLIHNNPQADPRKVPNPDLLIVVLPDTGNTAIYDEVKCYGNNQTGIPTQCLQASKCKKAKLQYWANVALKTNIKLGGINVKPDAISVATSGLCDPNTPTIVMGADVIHPPPGSTAPSYAATVANVDSNVVRYIAETWMQASKEEIIQDLGGMVKRLLGDYMNYRINVEKKTTGTAPPLRLLFFRDSVSAGQYEQVKNDELKQIVNACKDLKINPKITFVIVAKQHHFRFSPSANTPAQLIDHSGNSVAGTVVDTDITHPIEFDFYLQSHGGLLEMSRSAHYHNIQ